MAENDQESEEEPKSSKKLIIIIVAVLLLVGGGAGYYFFFMGNAAEAEVAEVEEEEEEAQVKDYFYFDIEKPFIVQFRKGSAARLLQVSLSIQVKNEEFIEELKKHQPMIRNNLLMIINDSEPAELKTAEAKLALKSKILKELNSIMDKMSKKNQIEDVFFTSLVMQ